MPPLKRQNLPRIVWYVFAHALGLAWVLGGGAFPADWEGRFSAAASSTAVSGFLAIGHVIFSGLLGNQLKAFLVTWRPMHPLPGCRAFTRVGPSDARVDMQAIRARHDPLPDDPLQQNRLWFKIYRKHCAEPSVVDAHGDYLLTRELASLTLLFAVVLPAIALAHGVPVGTALYYGLVLLGLYATIALAGQHYSRRLVASVLAIEGASAEVQP